MHKQILAAASGKNMDFERRRAPRYQFIANAEVVEGGFGSRFEVKTGDLSIGGCFVSMPRPSQQGSEIRVTISQAHATFTALGRVVFVFPGLGMGVAFTYVEPRDLAILEKWLGELERSRSAGIPAFAF
jgi:hypothetical protein